MNQIRNFSELEDEKLNDKSAKVIKKLNNMDQSMNIEKLNPSN